MIKLFCEHCKQLLEKFQRNCNKFLKIFENLALKLGTLKGTSGGCFTLLEKGTQLLPLSHQENGMYTTLFQLLIIKVYR